MKDEFVAQYPDLKRGKPDSKYPPVQYSSEIYALVGLGSRGILYSQLCAELLAAQINGEPLPVENNLVERLMPARFLVRELKSQK